ncbi:hypothetical protein PQI07_26150 [Methylobacterium sp. 092160098-2]|uniref:hypothetical protein n=1 Tax=Methylobacterium sp. 092160098-2 TaxID=3025129 RepID=UPI002381B15C|nr:hypothetical protein [Methylobacterium sp. 092160098-2]MDE4914155.1 hypothetical protein [Methylobacterium sp. 092160098-2]
MTAVVDKKEIERQAMVDYLQVAGKVVLASTIECYDEGDNSVTAVCDPPAVVRISPYGSRQIFEDVLRWTDGMHLDPYYDIEVLEPHPALAGLRPSWTFGPGRGRDGTVDAPSFALGDDACQERYRDATGLSDAEAGGPSASAAPRS